MSGTSKALISFFTIPVMLAWPAPQDDQASGANCTFQANPDAILSAQSRVRRAVFDRAQKLNRTLSEIAPGSAASTDIEHRNFIDDEIFNKLASSKIAPASLSTDEEFFR